MTTRSYSKLKEIEGFRERYEYLKLQSSVGVATFGYDRWMNQQFYTSTQWRQVRHHVIARDNGCDLGVDGHEIYGRLYIHHLNPLTIEDLREGAESIIDPEYLITTTHLTHNAIHYGDDNLLPRPVVERKPGDTKLW